MYQVENIMAILKIDFLFIYLLIEFFLIYIITFY